MFGRKHRWDIIAVLVFAFPLAALADMTGTTTLHANTALNLDTGATVSSGGDILWSGSSLIPQGKATAFAIAAGGSIHLTARWKAF